MSFKEIHDWLNKQERMLDGRQVWRLVWSENLTEKRQGTFRDFYGPIFIREYKGIKEARKYNYIHERWILEKFNPCLSERYSISGDNSGSYEPVWTFETGKGEYLAPTLKSVQFIIEFARQSTVMTPGERAAWAQRAEDEEFKKCYEEIGSATSDPVPSLLHSHNGVSFYAPKKGK